MKLSSFASLLALLIFPLSGLTQATTGYHRIGQVVVRSNSSVNAQVVPFATVTVTDSATGLPAVIYSDPGLSVQIDPPVVTANEGGNYDYYFSTNYCETEQIDSVSQGSFTLPNVCSNTAGLGNPVLLSEGGTGQTTAPNARTALGAAASGTNGDITSLTGILTPLPITEGGTGISTLPTHLNITGNGTYAPPTLVFNTTESAVMDGINPYDFMVPGHPAYSVVTGAGIVPNSATTWQNNAVTGIMQSNSSSSSVNSVGVYGQSVGTVSGSQVWGSNFVVDDAASTSQVMRGEEIDVGVYGTPTAVIGLLISGNSPGGGAATGPQSYGLSLEPLSSLQWKYGLNIADGAAETGLVLGAQSTGSNSSSSILQFSSKTSLGVAAASFLQTDPNGNLVFSSSNAGAVLHTPHLTVDNTISGSINGNAATATQVFVTPAATGTIFLTGTLGGNANFSLADLPALSYNAATGLLTSLSYGNANGVLLPSALTGDHGNGAKVQLSDGTGTVDHPAVWDASGNLTDGPAGFTGTCASSTTLTVVKGIITGCS